MTPEQPPIKIVAHFGGPVSVRAGGYEVEVEVSEPGVSKPIEIDPEHLDIPELDIPELLMAEEPGALVALSRDLTRSDRPVVLASHGHRIDLRTRPELLRSAHAAGRPVEIHLYSRPGDVPGSADG